MDYMWGYSDSRNVYSVLVVLFLVIFYVKGIVGV